MWKYKTNIKHIFRVWQQICHLLHLVYDLVQYKYELTEESTCLMINCLLIWKTMIGRTDILMLFRLTWEKFWGPVWEISTRSCDFLICDGCCFRNFKAPEDFRRFESCFFHYIGFIIYAFFYIVYCRKYTINTNISIQIHMSAMVFRLPHIIKWI